MVELSIITIPNNILITPCKNVDDFESIQDLILDMKDTLDQYNALGLAANQIGISKNIIVYREKDEIQDLVNPKIIARIGKTTFRGESCLSIPDKHIKTKRSKQIVVEGFRKNGEFVRIKPRGKLLNIVLQHEIDHLNGILMLEREI